MLFGNELISILDNYWRSIGNQRKFFIEFAAQQGFDPLVPGNWDKITIRAIIKKVRINSFYYKFEIK